MIYLKIVFVLSAFVILVECSGAKSSLIMNRYSTCPGDEKNPVHFLGNITKVALNKYVMNGGFTFRENVTGPIGVYKLPTCQHKLFQKLIKQLRFFSFKSAHKDATLT